ncbi:hypothetical protein [Methylocapsa palsarum]|uniref:Uncharacterized protein n=1 Tax=Methylocapsa palsarum TaxID=1612308 RepID=A0A1I4A6E9_9HYPH|nr:hypothetical protein [Methylocapsa palsarum]SFK51913.1 hypothetical protein SAMN05444581_109110 [Methylocapsa palsarum]
MKRFGALTLAAALGSALLASGPASAQQGVHGRAHGAGWHDGSWDNGGWQGGAWPAISGLGLGLGLTEAASGAYDYVSPYSSYDYNGPYAGYGYGYPTYGYDFAYGYPYGPGTGFGTGLLSLPGTGFAVAGAPTAPPLTTGRSAAAGGMGASCSTPAKTCELTHASMIGNGCSCRVEGGRARGSVTP